LPRSCRLVCEVGCVGAGVGKLGGVEWRPQGDVDGERFQRLRVLVVEGEAEQSQAV
jgi:hypothetical protein